MGIKHKTRQSERSVAMGTTLGVGACILLWILSSAAVAALIVKEYVEESSVQWIVPCMQMIVSFAGSYCASKIATENRGVASVVCTAVYFVLMAGITMLIFDGNFSGVLFTAIAVAVGGVLSILLNLKRRSHSARGRRMKISR